MTPQELRGSILSLAIQGKLTERLSEDGAARELLFDSVVENNVDGQRVKEKIITEITDDEKAFDNGGIGGEYSQLDPAGQEEYPAGPFPCA